MSNSVIMKTSPEDSFYENLTLGLIKVLNNIPRITNVMLEKRQPCERAQVTTWEQRHNVYLPDDMKRFYLSTDGFTLHWCYQYSPNDLRRVGFLSFPHLLQITLLRENIELITNSNGNNNNNSLSTTTTSSPSPINSVGGTTFSTPSSAAPISILRNTQTDLYNSPQLNARSKIFELSNICEMAKVCIIYETPEMMNPKIYLLEMQTFKWQFLADTFTEYQRMSIAHLGLPYWELCFSSCGLPSWTEQLFLLLAPHLLEKNEIRRNRILQNTTSIHEQNRIPTSYNILDSSIFRTKPKCSSSSRQIQKKK